MCCDGPLLPALIATLSSPARIHECAMVTLLVDDGSMPSVLRAQRSPVLIFTPHSVKPFVRYTMTWKFGEFRSVMRYKIKLSACVATIRRGQLCDVPSRLACCARSHL